MAGNRLHWTGSIFERINGILKGGALKEKPLWYDVYKAFPPKYNPSYLRPSINKEIKPIFYPEDLIRAKFFQKYGFMAVHDLLYSKTKSVAQRFVEKYQELEKTGKFQNEELLFNATEIALADDGITFIKRKDEQTSKPKENISKDDIENKEKIFEDYIENKSS